MRANDYYWSQRKLFWGIMIFYTLVIAACTAFLAMHDTLTDTIKFCCFMIAVMDIVLLFSAFVAPRLKVNKSNALDATLNYTFKDVEVAVNVDSKDITDSATIKYSAFVKVGKNGDDVYLFISNRQWYTVDLSSLTDLEVLALKSLVTSHLPPKKVKWK